MVDFKKHREWSESLTMVMQVGLTMAGCIFFCFFVGLYLDKWLGTRGIFVTIFTILGVLGGANTVYRMILKSMPSDKDKDRDKDSDNGID